MGNRAHYFLEPGAPGWSQAWDGLARLTGDSLEALDPETGEVWQYMGTWQTAEAPGWVHEFRHRHHPATGARRYVHVPAPPPPAPYARPFDPADCGGAWDGFQVTSDADPGL